MKIAAVLLLTGCSYVDENQSTNKITLSEKNASLEKVVEEIKSQTGYKFLYNSQLLINAPKVTFSVKNADIKETLDLILKSNKMEYAITENTITIRSSEDSHGNHKPPMLVDKKSGVDSGVDVTIKSTPGFTTINLYGEYIVGKINGNYIMLIAAIAYDIPLDPMQNKRITQLTIIRGLDEMQVIAFENATFHPYGIFRRRVPGVQVVLLTRSKKSMVNVWIPGGVGRDM